MTEQALAQAWLERRDADAFQGLCEKHAGMVHATALRMLRNAADAEDVTQECFLRLARTSTTIRGSIGAWLHRVAVNLSIDRMRRDSSRRAREETFADMSPTTTEVTWNDLREHVDAAINVLPDRVRDTVIAHFIEGVSQQAIADAEGITRSAVSQRINRALQMVRATLKKRGVSVSLTALTALLTANLAEAVAVPAGLMASLGNLAVYAGATNVAAGAAASVLTAKGIAAVLTALLVVGGLGIVVFRSQNTGGTAAPVVPINVAATASPNPISEAQPIPEPDTSSPATVAASSAEPAAVVPAVDTGATVEGYVREQDTDRPLAGVSLVCQPDDGSTTFQFEGKDRIGTDEDGRYRITGLAPGRYKLLCSSEWKTRDPGDPEDYQVELRFAQNKTVQRFEITDIGTQAGPDFQAIVGETITGNVVTPDGTPVPDAVVALRGAVAYVNTRTTANGWFKAGGFPVTGEVFLEAQKGRTSGGIRTRATGETETLKPESNTQTSAITGPLTVTAGGLKNVQLVLRPGASVSGTLVDHLGQPLAEVNLMARSTAKGYFGSRYVKTDENGGFVVAGLAEGVFDLAWNPRKPGEDEQMYSWTPSEALVLKRIEVTWGQHRSGIQLRAADAAEPKGDDGEWTLSGRIRDSRGQPIAGATVHAFELGKSGGELKAQSLQDGSYSLPGLYEGHFYLLRAEHADYSGYMDSLREPVKGPFDIVLEDRGTVSGQVRYADTGMPVTRFSVRMQKGANQPVLVENDEGRFRMEGADAGENQVLVSAEGYKETGTPVTVLPGREVAGVEVRLERGLAVEGTVVDENGKPVEGALVFAKRVPTNAAERETQALAKTDANGRFRLESLDKDWGSIAAWDTDLGVGAAFYDTSAPTIEIVLRNNMGSVSGRVLADGQVPADAKVSLMPVELLSAVAAAFGSPNHRINEDGTFRFDDVPEGEYDVSVSMGEGGIANPMGRNLAQRIAVETGKETEVLLDLPPEESSVDGQMRYQGEPVSQGFVLLTLESPAGKQTHTAQVAEDGSYSISPIAAGHATLRASVVTQSPFSSVSQTLEFEIAPGEAVHRDINFDAHGIVRGSISGVPADRQIPIALLRGTVDLSDVTLETVLAVLQESAANTMVRGSGSFEFSAVPPGEYTVFAWVSQPSGRVGGYAGAFCTVPEDETPVSVTLRMQSK